jgi:hypothetical protein
MDKELLSFQMYKLIIVWNNVIVLDCIHLMIPKDFF